MNDVQLVARLRAIATELQYFPGGLWGVETVGPITEAADRLIRATLVPETLYYECHITLDPVKGLERELADFIAAIYAFKLAKLLMQKPGLGRLEESKLDTFMTGHSRNYDDIKDRMVSLIALLKTEGFVVRRYKIEACVLDSRTADTLGLL